jgi:hypothetical protein
MRKQLSILTSLLILSPMAAQANTETRLLENSSPDQVADSLYPQTGTPVMLPELEAFYQPSEELQVYIRSTANLGTGWSVIYGFSETCEGQHVCSLLNISARYGKLTPADWAKRQKELKESYRGGRWTAKTSKLSDGSTLYYSGGVGAYPSHIGVWEYEGVVYTLGSKGTIENYVKIADSMIAGGIRGSSPDRCNVAIDKAGSVLVGNKLFSPRAKMAEHSYKDGPIDRSKSVKFLIGGAYVSSDETNQANAVMRSPQLQKKAAKTIFDGCSNVGIVTIGLDSSGFGYTWGYVDNQPPLEFSCVEPDRRRGNQPLPWGQEYCT